jgi:predicted ATPase/class 3 adenylate cyclase
VADLPTGTVTFFFSDIEESTGLLERLGQQFAPILDQHESLVRAAVAEAGGLEVGTEGDSIFAVFTSPSAAVKAAVATQRGLAAHPWPPDAAIRVRIGLHTGEGLLGADNYVGLDVNRAARIGSAGHGGQVLISETTRALVAEHLPDGVGFRTLGRYRLKGLAHPEALSQLIIPGLPAEFPALRSVARRLSNLPVELSTFVGRGPQLLEVRRLLSESRLITLTGPGGAGKTRLALRVAAELLDEFADGVVFVELAPVSDPDFVPAAIAAALGVREEPSRSIAESLQEHLRERELLLVLDNFEQVIAAAPVATDLLRSAPRLRMLATSRTPLRLTGEHEYPVPPLRQPDLSNLPPPDSLSTYDAVALFAQRARAIRPDFAITTENATVIAQICARLDGLPLAIELAAARIRVLSLDALLARMGDRLSVLSGGPRDLPARQRTLRDTIAWSYNLLDPVEQGLFRSLAVFAGGWSLEAAKAVWDAPDRTNVLDVLTSLVDHSLISRADAGDGDRFAMLETIREFALERLTADGELADASTRHAWYFAEFAQAHMAELIGPDKARWRVRLELELDNLRAALSRIVQFGPAELGLTLGASLWNLWRLRGHVGEGRRWLQDLLSMSGATVPSLARARVLAAAAEAAGAQGDHHVLRAAAEEALAIYRQLGDARGIVNMLNELGVEAVMTRDPARARLFYAEALAISSELASPRRIADSNIGLGLVALLDNDRAGSREYVEQADRRYRAVPDQFGLVTSQLLLGWLDRLAGNVDRARARYAESLALARETGDVSSTSLALVGFADLAIAEGATERAARLTAAADELREQFWGMSLAFEMLESVDPREAARAALSEEVYLRAQEEGRAMTIDQAIADAMDSADVADDR